MTTQPTKRQIARGCRHFTGIQHDACEAGIAYAPFLGKNHPDFPCITRDDGTLSGVCPAFAFLSEEEIEAEEREGNEAVEAFFKALADDICPHCGAKITHKRQVGRCVYADPCGHRLYQGKLTDR